MFVNKELTRTNWVHSSSGKRMYYIIFWKWSLGIDFLTLSWRRPISYRNQSTDLLCNSMDWFLYDIGLRHERVNWEFTVSQLINDNILLKNTSKKMKINEITDQVNIICTLSPENYIRFLALPRYEGLKICGVRIRLVISRKHLQFYQEVVGSRYRHLLPNPRAPISKLFILYISMLLDDYEQPTTLWWIGKQLNSICTFS